MNEQSTNQRRSLIPVVITLILVWLIRFLPYLFPEARLWGINYLLFLPPIATVIYAVIGILLIISLLNVQIGKMTDGWYRRLADVVLGGEYRFRWFLISFAVVLLFWLARMSEFLLGDSFSVAANIGNDLPVIFKWSETGAIYVAYAVSKILPFTGMQLGEYTYGVISVLSGGVTVYFFLGIAYETGRREVDRLLIFCLSIFAGWMLLFFGYTENYPILWPFVSGYIYFGIRYINGKGSLVVPGILILTALVLHAQTLFFLISFPFLVISRGWGGRFYRRFRKTIIFGAIGLSMAAIAFFVNLYQTHFELQLYMIPLWDGIGLSAVRDYQLFSPAHLLDITNLFLLLVPLLPVLIILWVINNKSTLNPTRRFLMWFSIGGFFFLLLIEPKLGMARDWDLLALCGLAPILYFTTRVSASFRRYSGLYLTISLMSFIIVLPFYMVNMNRDTAIANFKNLLSLDLPRGRTGMTILRDKYQVWGDSVAVDSLNRILRTTYPAVSLIPEAGRLLEEGFYDQALAITDSLNKIDPNSIELLNLRGRIFLKMGNYARAIRILEKAAGLGQYDSRILVSLAQAYFEAGNDERMMQVLRQAQKRNPNHFSVIEGMATAFAGMRRFDSAGIYALKMIDIDSSYAEAYKLTGYAAYKTGDSAVARRYFNQYLELFPKGKEREVVENILKKLNGSGE